MFYRVTEASYPDREPAGHPRLEAVYERSMFELNEFFGIDWVENRPNVVLLPTRKIIDLIRGEATESWLVGWVSRRQVYLFSEDHYESECCHTYSEARYDATLKHELTHCFINVISGGTRNAIWLQEWLCIFLSGQHLQRKRPKRLANFLDYYDHGGEWVYKESGFAIEFLVNTYGKEKLLFILRQLKSVESQEGFNTLFVSIYGFEPMYDRFVM